MATIYIQMGHCFRSTGATGAGGEQEFNKAVAARAAHLLRKAGHTVKVHGADERVFKTDVFVAIHADGAENPKADGASIGYQDDNGRRIGEAWKRAYQRLGWRTGFRSDNYTTALAQYYGVRLAREAGTRYAFVIEGGFLTNPVEGAELRSTKGRTRAAKAIARAVEQVVGEGRKDRPVVADTAFAGTAIGAAPRATRKRAHAWADARGCAPVFHKIIDAGWSHARAMGIDPAVFVAQAAKETAFGKFTGVLDASFHNSCGLKTTQGGDNADPAAHQRFRNWSAGTRAHCAHLALYAGKLTPKQAGKHGDPRNFPSIAGTAKTVEKLGGAWAPSPDYGKSLVRDYLWPLTGRKRDEGATSTRAPVATPRPVAEPTAATPRPAGTKLRALVAEVKRLDAETDRAWERVVAYGQRRRRSAATAEARDVATILLRIEAKLGSLLERDRQQEAAPAAALQPEVSATAPSPTAADGPLTSDSTGNGAGQESVAVPARRRLVDLSDAELGERIERLEGAIGGARAELIRRYARAENRLALLSPEQAPRRDRVRTLKAKNTSTTKRSPRDEVGRSAGRATPDDVRALQRRLNQFTDRYLKDVGPIVVDGVNGPSTKKRIVTAKYLLGDTGKEQRSPAVTPEFLRRLRHPRSARLASAAAVARGARRRRRQRKDARRAAAPRAGVAKFDNRPVAAWLVPYLDWARRQGWRGNLISGYRTPAQSEEICRNMCGAPRCRNCAGTSSNHSGKVRPAGAVDVSEHVQFAELMKRCPHSPPIINALGAGDPNHFSVSGR